MLRLTLLFVLLSSVFGCHKNSNLTAIVGATVVVGEDFDVIPEANILFEDGHVSCVGTNESCPESSAGQVIDASGKWVIPGLVDFHTHVAEYSSMPWAPLFLAYGITTVRDVGGRTDSSFALRKRWQTNYSGPNLFISGHPIDGDPPNWPAVFPDLPWKVSTTEEAIRRVRQADSLGVDFIKLYSGLTSDAFEAAVSEAKKLDLKVTADIDLWNTPTSFAIDAGINGIEHRVGELIDVDLPMFTGERARLAWGRDDEELETLVAQIVENDVLLTTTLILSQYLGSDFPYHKDTYKSLPVNLQDTSRIWLERINASVTEQEAYFWRVELNQQICTTVVAIHNKGGKTAAGTDAFWQTSYPGDIHEELKLLQECGLSPKDVLATATTTPANWFGADSLGRIQSGSIADFVVLNADPMTDISNTQEIEYVVRRGNILYPSDLIEQAKSQ